MRISTFTGMAAVFGKDRHVSVEEEARASSDTGRDPSVELTIYGLSVEEAQKILASLEGSKPEVKKEAPAAEKPAAATKPAAEKPAAVAAATKPAAAATKPATKAAPAVAAKAAPVLDPAGPDDDDDDGGDGSESDDDDGGGASVDNDPWGLSSTPIPPELMLPTAKLREVIKFCQQQALATNDEELTEEQIVTAVTAVRPKIPLVQRIEVAQIAGRVHGCLQVMGAAGARPAATH